MPYDDPEPGDPHVLVGVAVSADEGCTREMAAAFADEFARAGLGREEILTLYRNRFYAGANLAWQLLGKDEIGRIVDESLDVWGRLKLVVRDDPEVSESREHDAAESLSLVQPNGRLRMLS